MKINLRINYRQKAYYLLFICLLSYGVGKAQSLSVSGNVTGEGEPLPGVSVIVKGTNTGVVTDFDGNYSVNVDANSTLVFTYIGFTKKEVLVKGESKIDVVLSEDVSKLDEVVVVGYGIQKKKEVAGAVSQVKSKDIENTATSDLATALQGQISGVTVVSSSGAPGAEANIQIRGLTSVFGANRPLYVVDGIPFEADPQLSIAEIESVDVLKDAASAAIYGTRGAAGVILITTKRGKEGKMNISANSYYGVQSITSGTPLLQREDDLYLTFLTAFANSGSTFGNTWTSVERSPHQLTNNSSLVDVIQNDNAPIQNHNINVSGGRQGLSYNISANFFSQEGSVINSGFERLNVRTNTEYKKGKWKIGTGLSFRLQDREFAPWQLARQIIRAQPLQTQLDLGQLESNDSDGGSGANNVSFLGQQLLQDDNEERHYFDGNLRVTYNFTDNLSLMTRGSVSADNATRIRIQPLFIVRDIDGEEVARRRSSIFNQSSLAKKSTLEHVLNYNKQFGDHKVNLTATYSAEKYTFSQFFAQRSDINNNAITVLNGAISDPNAGSGTGRFGGDREDTFVGMLGRLQYNYKGKYLLSASVRRDGSSKFAKESYGVFPSISLGWNVSDENFWKYLEDTVSSFKVRLSQGTTGNSGIPSYSFASNIILENDYVFGNGDDQNLQAGAIQQSFGNQDVRWETSVSTNFGYDISFLENRLTFTSDVYTTKKKDMLFDVSLPATAGVSGGDANVVLNIGNMVNTGIEFAANYRSKGDRKFTWNAGLTYTKNENRITKMAETNPIIYFGDSTISGADNDTDRVTVLTEGVEAGAFMLVKTDGVIQTEEELAVYLEEFPGSGARIGDLRMVDALTVDIDGDGTADTGDGIIDINDRQYHGSGTPEFELGFNFASYYKNFDFSTQIYGSFGAEIINGSKAYAYQLGAHRDLIHGWSPQNPTSQIPIYRGNQTHDNFRGRTDFWLEDGTFVRLRNITLGYSYPKARLEKIGLSKLRLYVTGQNLITLTKYEGFDPEVGNNGLSTRGIDRGTYPISSQVRAGLQIEF